MFREGWLLVPLVSGCLCRHRADVEPAATLESAFALCLGCTAERFLWECDDCADISERLRTATANGVPATN